MSTEPTVESILANLDKVREIKATSTVTLPNGVTHSFTVEEDSNDPAKLKAFDERVARQQDRLDAKTVGCDHPDA